VANVLSPVAHAVIEARTGGLLWIGGLVGLWTVGSLVETIRDILRRAYGTRLVHAFWRYRLMLTGITIGSVILILLSITAQVAIGTVMEKQSRIPARKRPALIDVLSDFALHSRAGPVWRALASVHFADPGGLQRREFIPNGPAPLFVTLWWLVVTTVPPEAAPAPVP
jgi:membrane protein